MSKIKQRLPEGGAIVDDESMTTEEYSKIMKEKLGREYLEFANHVINDIQPVKNAKALEIGPGPGWAGIFMLRERKDIFLDAMEASKDMIKTANINAQNQGVKNNVNYIEGQVENMSKLQNDYYDLVISRDSLHHWENPVKAFKEINRVLKPGGKVFIQDGRRDLSILAKFIVNVIGRLMAGKMLKYWKSSLAASYTPEEIMEMLKGISINDWIVKSNILELYIEKK
jgi:ubiquinone/menaquinone biosynthesis C-methylase UbiE